jgi:hypothetical protein
MAIESSAPVMRFRSLAACQRARWVPAGQSCQGGEPQQGQAIWMVTARWPRRDRGAGTANLNGAGAGVKLITLML